MTVRFHLQKISPLHVVYTLSAVGVALSALITVITFGIAERVAIDLTVPRGRDDHGPAGCLYPVSLVIASPDQC